jgi:hypothetical protein
VGEDVAGFWLEVSGYRAALIDWRGTLVHIPTPSSLVLSATSSDPPQRSGEAFPLHPQTARRSEKTKTMCRDRSDDREPEAIAGGCLLLVVGAHEGFERPLEECFGESRSRVLDPEPQLVGFFLRSDGDLRSIG